MVKKIICMAIGMALSMAELLFFGVKPLVALAGCILPVGFTALAFIILTDYLQDKKITKLMIASYVCAFLTVVMIGVAFQVNRIGALAIAAIFAIATVVLYFLDKKKEAVVVMEEAKVEPDPEIEGTSEDESESN